MYDFWIVYPQYLLETNNEMFFLKHIKVIDVTFYDENICV
jgi:hypothetical protein